MTGVILRSLLLADNGYIAILLYCYIAILLKYKKQYNNATIYI